MMIDLQDMAESHQKQQDDTDWQPVDNPWTDERIATEVEKLNVMARIYEGDDG